MPNRVFVTGIGIICAIGNNTKEVLNSIYSKKTGISLPSSIETIYKNEFPTGVVKSTNAELIENSGINISSSYSRTALLGMKAAKEAFLSANLNDISALRTGLISATSVGGMDRSELFFNDYYSDNKKGRLKNIIGHDCGFSTEAIADYLGIKDYVSTISTACSSSANSIMFGARLITNNILDRVLVGGVDSLTKFTINGFNSLMILNRDNCKPFDEQRAGLNLGEGAGYLVIESERAIEKDNKEIYCELTGYGNASDAYHQTASSPDGAGACLAMRKALDKAGLAPKYIDYINAHGTGTLNNDLSEAIAIETVFESYIPKFSSTKPYTGHTLGASGGIEAVLCALSIKNNLIYPNLNFTTQMKEITISPETELLENCKVNHVLSNSFGFGGNNTSLIFSRH